MTTETQTTAPAVTRQMSFTILDDGTIRAEFGPNLDPLTVNPQALPEDIFPMALAEGIISRLRSYSSKLSGSERTPEALRDATAEGIANLEAGKWKVERAPGSGSSEITIEAEAAHVYRVSRFAETNPGEVYTNTLAEDAAIFAALSDDTKDEAGKVIALGQRSKVKATQRYQIALAQVKAKRLAEKAAKLAAKVSTPEVESDF
jgi:hypothetical protein